MSSTKYKIGDRIVQNQSENCGNFTDYGADFAQITGILSDSYEYDLYKDGKKVGNCSGCLRDETSQPYELTLETLRPGATVKGEKWGDVVTFTVEGVLGRVYVGVDEDGNAVLYTAKELEDNGYELPEVETPVKELTVADVEKLVGSKVKIVKE